MKIKKTILTLALVGAGICGFQGCNGSDKSKEGFFQESNKAKIESLIEKERIQIDRHNSLIKSLE